MLHASYREYDHERSTEYRGTVVGDHCQEVDVCTHRHRSVTSALACGKRMAAKLARARQSYLDGKYREMKLKQKRRLK